MPERQRALPFRLLLLLFSASGHAPGCTQPCHFPVAKSQSPSLGSLPRGEQAGAVSLAATDPAQASGPRRVQRSAGVRRSSRGASSFLRAS